VGDFSVVLEEVPQRRDRTEEAIRESIRFCHRLKAATRKIFGKAGFPAHSWAMMGTDGICPAEVLANVEEAEAERAAVLLQETGATAQVLPTAEVSGVKWRAADLWPDRTVGDWGFSEVEDIVGSNARWIVRQAVDREDRSHPEWRGWKAERFLNHEHPNSSLCCSREGLRLAMEMGLELREALQTAYPGRPFVVTCVLGEDLVSFYQAQEDAPLRPGPVGEVQRRGSPWVNNEAQSWCDACGSGQVFEPRTQPDAEFPMVEWATCRGCGGEMVIGSREVLLLTNEKS
jgi:hypothetical protein